MGFKFNPFTGTLDLVSDTSGFVLKTGDTMTGDLEFDTETEGIILKSGSGTIAAGSPMGLLAALTYPTSIGSGLKRWKISVDDSGALTTTLL